MSSCDGFQGGKIARRIDRCEPPFHALVANVKHPTWDDCKKAYVEFYRRLARGASLDAAVNAMRIASRNEFFSINYGRDITAPWIRLMANIRDGELGESLRERYRPLWMKLQPNLLDAARNSDA